VPSELPEEYRWHDLIYSFIIKLQIKEKEVYKMNYINSLNWLSYFKAKDKVESNKQNNK